MTARTAMVRMPSSPGRYRLSPSTGLGIGHRPSHGGSLPGPASAAMVRRQDHFSGSGVGGDLTSGALTFWHDHPHLLRHHRRRSPQVSGGITPMATGTAAIPGPRRVPAAPRRPAAPGSADRAPPAPGRPTAPPAAAPQALGQPP